MKKLLAITTLAVGLVSCGPVDICGKASPCPNDTPSTPAEVSSCRAELAPFQSAPCYTELMGYLGCTIDARVCASNGTTDSAQSQTRAATQCASQLATAQACCEKSPTSAACQ